MKTKYILVALCLSVVTAFYACKKSEKLTPETEVSAEKIKVGLRISGITTVTTPMENGRKLPVSVAARTIFDSTFYAVDVRLQNGAPYAQGLYNSPEGIVLELTKNEVYLIRVAAIKKGTSYGIPPAGISGGYVYLYRPFDKPVTNEMVYNTAVPNSPDALNPTFLDSLTYMPVLENPFTGETGAYKYPELEIYYQSLQFSADTSSSLNLALHRICFGINYNLINFEDGILKVEYDGMKTKTFTQYGGSDEHLSIYTADQFRYSDTIYQPVNLTFTFMKYDGTIVPMGTKSLYPRRNMLTTINVTQPAAGRAVDVNTNIFLTDTAFAGGTTVPF